MLPRRKRSLRWFGYNYATVATYFITLCIQGRQCRLGRVVDSEVGLSAAGEMIKDLWLKIPARYPHVALGKFVIMPNHIHGLICFRYDPIADGPQPDLGRVIGWWKSPTTRAYMRRVKAGTWPAFNDRLWQVGYHDRVIRDEEERCHAEGYIVRNPRNWREDHLHPEYEA